MDSRQSPANEYGQRVSLSIASLLVSAVLEWMLIFLLFIDANFSYLVTRFARYCQLQIPCLLCSRLDHVLGSERSGFYWDLICHRHKLKISSLVLCKLHDNLVDVHGTCESCLFSFATVNKSNAETYRLLVGKLGAEPCFGLAEGATSDEHNNGSSGTRICACCNEQWISRTYTENLFQSKSIDSEGAELDPYVTSKYNVDEVQEITEGSSQLGQKWNKDADLLPHVEYTKVKVTSDTESEGPFWDNENENALICETEISSEDSPAEYVSMEPQIITFADCPALEKSIDPAQPTEFSLTESGDPTNSRHNVEPEAPVGHGLEELNRKQPDHKNGVSEPSELISSSEALPSPNVSGTHYYESKETNDTSPTQMEKVVHGECREASNVASDAAGTAELWKEVAMEHEDTLGIGRELIQADEIPMDLQPNKNDSSQISESLDLGAAYKLALGIRGRQLSGRLLEQQRSMKESLRASEDLKLLLSQISSRGIEVPLNDMSANSEDSKAMDASIATGIQIIQRISLERNESTLSLDGSTISEIEGESVEDRLRRQVEHDKKIMSTLFKELEEERNATAIAANQSMAMITRLQEEKAALHMEALQCLRMMDEQAEHDDEALQQANDLLTDKEKQIQDLEYELELYKNQFGDISLPNTCVRTRSESDVGVLKTNKIEANCEESNMTAFSNSDSDKHDICNKIDGAPKTLDREMASERISLSQFEDEKRFILQCLIKLEEKLYMFAKHDTYSDMVDDASSTGEALKASAPDQLDSVGVSQENGRTKNNNLPTDAVMHKETPSKDLCGNENESEGYGEFKSGQHANKDADLDALRHEFSVINNRLEALEAEKNVIECSINSLEKGSEAFEFIREIAVWLQELHSVHIRTRNEDLT